MRYDSYQFGAFDGLDNRRTIYDCFRRMGGKLPEWQAAIVRGEWLQWLARQSKPFEGRPIEVTPCSVSEAYDLFVAITGCLGVGIDEAAKLLEEAVR